MRMRLLFVIVAALAAAAPGLAACPTGGYSYGGVLTATPARGLAATVSPVGLLQVASGHVAAWVGVGGPGQGAGGRDAWLQIGIAAYPGGTAEIYVEVTLPGRATRYTTLVPLRSDAPRRLAVVEAAPNVWQALLDGRPVTRRYRLPGSDGRWRPTVTAESYDGGYTACNVYAFELRRITVRGGPAALESFVNRGHSLRWLAQDALLVLRG